MQNRSAGQKLVYLAGLSLAIACLHATPAPAQINGNAIWGTCSSCGSGGAPSGPTNPGALGFGTSTGAGSGATPTGPLNPNAYGFGVSTGAGSGGIPTGPTVRGLQMPPIPPDLQIMAGPSGRQAAALPRKASAGRAVRVKPRRVIRRHR
jgi:hypothetical protein